jgi:hypothetical protein
MSRKVIELCPETSAGEVLEIYLEYKETNG